ncbi:PASTA domain-containing protein [Streptomyces antibioticus]|uniref:PASTA domain-containing protein n=1 Tax=Streptomyces antibioticus TaxID=1890 RepID=UPI000AAA8208|nr:PASTA domain-containing protein [Streptomyces antibioticus]MCX5173080.1 PASTA domain-containing protein [Streptomyces antibioticus]
MANWKVIGGIVVGVLVIGGIGSALDDKESGKGGDAVGSATPSASRTATSPAGAGPDGKGDVEKHAVPRFVGMGLQSAQDAAQEVGFYSLTSHDALGRGRMQAFDRNWKVCSQSVAAGRTVATDTELDFGAVKLDETCPAKDRTAPAKADGTMPDFKGKSVKVARAALDSGTSITVEDASADDRFVFLESNWQVCTQSPKAGAELNGQPVEFTAVKFGESCP